MDTQILASEVQNAPSSHPSDHKCALAPPLAAATVIVDTDRQAAKTCIQRAATLLGMDLAPQRSATADRSCPRRGLAPWQAKRIRSHILDNLDSSIRANDLAGIVQLSTSHFFRSFRMSFGESPRAYIAKRRIGRAKELMMTSGLPLSQVALECGLYDQAHLCRVFRRIVGINPKAWRRRFGVAPEPDPSSSREFPIRTRHESSRRASQRDAPCESCFEAANV
jgi:AraC family transcriptional regulator